VGNWSGWVRSAARKLIAYQNTNSHVSYGGAWTRAGSSRSSGTSYAYTTRKNSSARLTFSGRSVIYVAPKTSVSGKVKVYVDGTLRGTYNLKRSTTGLGSIIAKASWSAGGQHTIRIVAASSGPRVSLDAFIVLK
jgi:hypothetical protein